MKKIVLILIVTLNAKLFSQTTVAFTTPGTTNWTVPSCVTTITVQAWGGGGGGGGAASNQNQSGDEACSQGGGGGGGGFTSRVYTVTPGEVYTIVVGAGGNAGNGGTSNAAGNNGGNGGNSTFSGPATVLTGVLTANGGLGGGGAWTRNTSNGFTSHMGFDGAGGAGGSGSNGTTTNNGGNGSSGRHSGSCYDASGAGGGGAGTTSIGGNASAPASCTTRTGGTGGTASGGNGGNGRILSSYTASRQALTGNTGTAIGGGGSGAMIHLNSWPNTWTTASGGAGARGEVRILHSGATPPVLAISPPVCNTNSTSVNLSATASNTNSPIYAWTSTDGTINSGNASLTPNVKGPGTFTLIAYNGVTTCSTSANITLTNISCNLLPVELTKFNAERINEQVDLNWETASEINNDYFAVEKSLDGVYFQTIDVVKGKGNTYQRVNYQTTDKEPGSDITYYRLKQVDLNGKFTYSKIVTVEATEKDIHISQPIPNPFNEEFSISFQLKHKTEFITDIIDITGKKVRTDYDIFDSGTSHKYFHLRDYENGIYFLNIKSIDGSSNFNYKLIKN